MILKPIERPTALAGASLRERIFHGDVFAESTSPALDQLAGRARVAIGEAFAVDASSTLPNDASDPTWLPRLSAARQQLAKDPEVQALVFGALHQWKFDPQDCLIDRPRIRANQPGLASIVAAAPALYAHRDTWYANPQSQLNVWLALSDAPLETGFAIYPSVFATAVPNDSAAFHFDDFRREVGWQRLQPPASASYPRALGDDRSSDNATVIAPKQGRVVLFSAAHLHRTLAHRVPKIRWSIDFRVVAKSDLTRGAGAPNVDNASTGDASSEYWGC